MATNRQNQSPKKKINQTVKSENRFLLRQNLEIDLGDQPNFFLALFQEEPFHGLLLVLFSWIEFFAAPRLSALTSSICVMAL